LREQNVGGRELWIVGWMDEKEVEVRTGANCVEPIKRIRLSVRLSDPSFFAW